MGMDFVNDAGKSFLDFRPHTKPQRAINGSKRRIFTWPPGSTRSQRAGSASITMYIVTRQKDRKLCVDASVRRGTECNTDHQFLCAELRMVWKHSKLRPQKEVRRFDVSSLRQVHSTQGEEARSQRQEYGKAVVERAREEWPDEGTVEEKWRAMRTALVDTADEMLGRAKRSQPDWFLESEDTIRQFLQARNAAYTKWLSTGDRQELAKFREARGRARLAVRRQRLSGSGGRHKRQRGKGLGERKCGSA